MTGCIRLTFVFSKHIFGSTFRLKEFLEAQGLVGVEMPCAGLETAFRAQHAFNGWSSPADGPTIAVLCEYDALPGSYTAPRSITQHFSRF
jgi:metal-dependent amidase/aminoacylase/carboxypeptidase family protein